MSLQVWLNLVLSRVYMLLLHFSCDFFFFSLKKNNFVYLFMSALGLHCFAQALSSYGELLYVAVHGLLIAEASPVCTMALGSMGSEAVAPGL